MWPCKYRRQGELQGQRPRWEKRGPCNSCCCALLPCAERGRWLKRACLSAPLRWSLVWWTRLSSTSGGPYQLLVHPAPSLEPAVSNWRPLTAPLGCFAHYINWQSEIMLLASPITVPVVAQMVAG